MNSEPTPESIRSACCAKTSLDVNVVESWMESEDIQRLGATWSLVKSVELGLTPIDGTLNADKALRFHWAYLTRCFCEDPSGQWTLTRKEVLREVMQSFSICYDVPSILEDESVATAKKWLAGVYLSGDAAMRNTLISSFLSSLFEQCMWRDFFQDWRSDDLLKQAYCLAEEIAANKGDADTLSSVVEAINNPHSVSSADLQDWMQNRSLNVLSLVAQLVEHMMECTQPSLSNEEMLRFFDAVL